MKKRTKIITSLILFAGFALPVLAQTDDTIATQTLEETDEKWRFSLITSRNNADLRVIDSEITSQTAGLPDDLTIEFAEDLDVSATLVAGSVGYRFLPFAEVSTYVGYIASETATGVNVSGTFEGPLGFISQPVDLQTDQDIDADGLSWGIAIAGAVPLAKIRGRRLALWSSYRYSWNRLDNDTIITNASQATLGLVYPLLRLGERQTALTVGGSYNWITREVTQTRELGVNLYDIRITQDYEDPWAVQVGFKVPVYKDLSFSAGSTYALSGANSFRISLNLVR